MRTSSNVPVDGEKCSAAACAKRASSPRRACYALTHNVARLAEDHENARVLGAALSNIPGFSLAEPVETNMVFLAIEGATLPALTQHLADHGIKISGARWVLHKDVSSEDLQTLIKACEAFAAARG